MVWAIDSVARIKLKGCGLIGAVASRRRATESVTARGLFELKLLRVDR